MKPRDRVHRAIQRLPTDRVPIFMWFHPDTRKRLAAMLRVEHSAIDTVFGNDVAQTWVNNNYAMEGVIHNEDGESHIDDWGIRWIRRYGFNQIAGFPLAGAPKQKVYEYRFPVHRIPALMKPMETVAARAGDLFLGCDVSPCAFEMFWRLRGMEDALLDMAGEPDLANMMIDRCVDFSISLARLAVDRFPLDWLWAGDDVASQSGMIMDPALWRDMVMPHLSKLFSLGKSRGLPVAFHCCGAVRPIIPDLIDIGMDVLNPIQHGCPGMGAADLKKDFGDSVTFMGGVDTQGLLPIASAREVYKATDRLITCMTAGGGGYILAASHTIPPETPVENIFALFDAAGVTKAEIETQAREIRSIS